MPPDNTALPADGGLSEEDRMAAEWAAALAEAAPSSATEIQTQAEQVAPASFQNFTPTSSTAAGSPGGTAGGEARSRSWLMN